MNRMNLINGWVEPILKSPSSFCHPRIESIDLIVLHSIGLPLHQPALKDALDLLTGSLQPNGTYLYKNLSTLKVSAHFVIGRAGELYQLVSLDDVAWHCGHSVFKGRENCNEYSIGIELIGHVWQGFTSDQYEKVIELTAFLINEYQLNIEAVVGHQHISPGRKTDPGYFDWCYFKSEVAKKLILS